LSYSKRIAAELTANGFEVCADGAAAHVAIPATRGGNASAAAERLLTEILDGIELENAAISHGFAAG